MFLCIALAGHHHSMVSMHSPHSVQRDRSIFIVYKLTRQIQFLFSYYKGIAEHWETQSPHLRHFFIVDTVRQDNLLAICIAGISIALTSRHKG
jgi:hypothetical protein